MTTATVSLSRVIQGAGEAGLSLNIFAHRAAATQLANSVESGVAKVVGEDPRRRFYCQCIGFPANSVNRWADAVMLFKVLEASRETRMSVGLSSLRGWHLGYLSQDLSGDLEQHDVHGRSTPSYQPNVVKLYRLAQAQWIPSPTPSAPEL